MTKKKTFGRKQESKTLDKDLIFKFSARTKAEHEYFLLTARKVLILERNSPEQRNREIHNTMKRLWINKEEKYGMVRIGTIHLALEML